MPTRPHPEENQSRLEADRLMPEVYQELRRLARARLRNDGAARAWQTTDLVHEVYIKLSQQDRVRWRGRSHFFAIGAQAMRRLLVDQARERSRQKRGSGEPPLDLDEALTLSRQRPADILALDEALATLAQLDPRQASIVEMRFFGGMQVAEVAEALSVSKRTVEAEWTAAKAWLRRELSAGSA